MVHLEKLRLRIKTTKGLYIFQILTFALSAQTSLQVPSFISDFYTSWFRIRILHADPKHCYKDAQQKYNIYLNMSSSGYLHYFAVPR